MKKFFDIYFLVLKKLYKFAIGLSSLYTNIET